MNTMEVTNPDAKLYVTDDDYYFNDDEAYLRLSTIRPAETEADLIAAAAYPGAVNRAQMITIKQIDGPHDAAVIDEGGNENACRTCNMPPHAVASEVRALKEYHEEFLREYGVEWDPTIRL